MYAKIQKLSVFSHFLLKKACTCLKICLIFISAIYLFFIAVDARTRDHNLFASMFRHSAKQMCLTLLFSLLISPFLYAGAFLANPALVLAASNSTINFQTKIVQKNTGLTPVNGSPSCINAGADTCDIRVSIYDSPSGGTLLWAETHTNVELGSVGGLINLSLNSVCNSWGSCGGGSGVNWGSDSTIYLQLELDTDGNGDFSGAEVFARKLISSVPFAYYADTAGSINGLTEENIVQLVPGATPQNVSSAANPLIYLDETDVANSPNLIQLMVGGTDAFVVGNSGSGYFAGTVSVGTSTATAYINAAAATTSQASLRLISSAGVNPSTPNSGDLWWNGTNLNFRTGSSTVDLLAAGLNSFVQGGNAFGALAVLGTTDTNALAFNTGGVERMRLGTNGTLGIGTTSATSQLQINTGTSSGAITMSASNGSSTFTTSASITLNAGDYIVPAAPNASQAREVTVGGTGTSFTVSPAFDADVTSKTFTIYRKSIMAQGARPILSLNQVFSPFASQEWQLRVGGVGVGSASFDIYNATSGQTAIRIDDDGDVLIGSAENYGGPGNASRLYVYGGANGANIDVMGNGAVSDQAVIELQSSDYATSTKSLFLQYYGVNGVGTTMGYNNQYLGVLSFSGDQAIIRTKDNIPLRFGVFDSEVARFEATSGNLTLLNDLTVDGGDILTTQSTFNLLNTGATTLNFAGAATTLNIGGAASSTVNIGPASTTATTINFGGGSSDTGCTINGSNGNLTCSGTISGSLVLANDSLDFDKFADALTLDANLTLDQDSFTWVQSFNGTSATGFAYNADSLTSGTALAVSSNSTNFTGTLFSLDLNGNATDNTGDVFALSILGTNSQARGLFLENRGSGNSLVIYDEASDTTPFVLDALGNLSVGGTSSVGGTLNVEGVATLESGIVVGADIVGTASGISVLNFNVDSINFGGEATTINIGPATGATSINFAGGNASSGCTMDGSGNLTCSGTINAGTFGIPDDSLNFAQFSDSLALDAATNIALGALTLSTSGTGALNFASTGQVTIAGNVDATNGLDVTGANLTVGGTGVVATTAGALTTSGLITAGNGLTVTTGATSLGGTLGVTGATTLSSTLGVTGATTLSSTLGVNGLATLSAGLTLTGATNINNNATTNTTNIGTGTTTGAIAIGGGSNTLSINTSSWDISSGGAASGFTNLTTTGLITAGNGLTVTTGATSLGGTLTVTGTTTLNGGANINNNASTNTTNIGTGTTTGAIAIGGGTNTLSINSSSWDISSAGAASGFTTLSTSGLITAGNGLTVTTGATSLGGTLGVTGATTLSSTLGVTGATTLSSTLGVNGLATLSAGLTLTGATNINNNASTNTTNIGTGTTTGAITIGGGSNTLGINTSSWDITTAGAASGFTTFNASGMITGTGGISISGGTVGLNVNGGTSGISIGTGTYTGTIGLGAVGASVIVATSTWNIGTDGTITTPSTITAGNLVSNANLTATGIVRFGNTANNYAPTNTTWNTGQSTLVLNALDYSVIAFHDSANRVDFIRSGAGTITLGYDGGFGTAAIEIPGTLAVTGNTTVTGTLGVTGVTTLTDITASGTSVILSGIPIDAANRSVCINNATGLISRNNGACGTSSIRYKENVQNISYGLNEVLQLRPVFFQYKEEYDADTSRKLGFIAEEVEAIIPEVGVYLEDGTLQTLDYSKLTSLNVKAIQELNAKFDTNVGQIPALDLRITNVESQVSNLSTQIASQNTTIANQGNQINDLRADLDQLISDASITVEYQLPGTATFNDLTVASRLAVSGQLILSDKNIGTATIAAGQTEVVVNLPQAFPNTPIVVASPIDSFVTYAVSNISGNSFKIIVSEPTTSNVSFNWFVSSR